MYCSPCQRVRRTTIPCSDNSELGRRFSAAHVERSDLGPSSCPYSPKCLEGEFCELRVEGVLRSSDTYSEEPRLAYPGHSVLNLPEHRTLFFGCRPDLPSTAMIQGQEKYTTISATDPMSSMTSPRTPSNGIT
jgi:hypothetical protein